MGEDPRESTSIDGGEQLPGMEPRAEEPTKPIEGAVVKPVEGAEVTEGKKEGEAPAPRMFTEVEWNTRQSKIDKQLAKIKDDSQKELQKFQQATEEANSRAREAEYTTFLKKVEDDGGDMNSANLIVGERRKADEAKAEVEKTKAWIAEQSAVLNLAGKGKQAQELAKQYSLPEESLEGLLESETPTEMENKALKLYVEKLKIEQKPPMEVDKGRGSGQKRDFSTMPASEALGTMMEESLK